MTKVYSKSAFFSHIQENFPYCPSSIRQQLVNKSFQKYNKGSIGACAGAAATNFIRHKLTIYDDLLANGTEKDEARAIIRSHVAEIFKIW